MERLGDESMTKAQRLLQAARCGRVRTLWSLVNQSLCRLEPGSFRDGGQGEPLGGSQNHSRDGVSCVARCPDLLQVSRIVCCEALMLRDRGCADGCEW